MVIRSRFTKGYIAFEIVLHSQRPATFGKDHRRLLQSFWCNYVSMSRSPWMFSSIDSSKGESVCGKAWWYSRDLPKVEILLHSRRPSTFGKDHKGHCSFFVTNYVPVSCLPQMFSNHCLTKDGGMVEMYQRLKYPFVAKS